MNRLILFLAMMICASNVFGAEVITTTLTNGVGVQCPATGVRVEAVEQNEALGEQTLTISIPEELMRGTSMRVLTPDLQALAFKDFLESYRDKESGRRGYELRMGKVGPMDFKIGFDSKQD